MCIQQTLGLLAGRQPAILPRAQHLQMHPTPRCGGCDYVRVCRQQPSLEDLNQDTKQDNDNLRTPAHLTLTNPDINLIATTFFSFSGRLHQRTICQIHMQSDEES